jgi:hypothetical protein
VKLENCLYLPGRVGEGELVYGADGGHQNDKAAPSLVQRDTLKQRCVLEPEPHPPTHQVVVERHLAQLQHVTHSPPEDRPKNMATDSA